MRFCIGSAHLEIATERAPVLEAARDAVLIRKDQTATRLTIQTDGTCSIRHFDAATAIRESLKGTRDETVIKAQATALGWAVENAKLSKTNTLLVWSEAAGSDLIELSESRVERGSRFVIHAFEVQLANTLSTSPK
jgi:hypothetical protein